jgi:Arc/MetJ-type ribon-helix-helix transcriptional regulator
MPTVGVTNTPLGPTGRERNGELDMQVAATVTSAIATSIATTLRRLVQPPLLPDIVVELGRLVAEPETGSGGGISVELPVELVERAREAVTSGQSPDVSTYIASAVEQQGRLAAVSGQLDQMLADAGALSDESSEGQPPTDPAPATPA